MPEIVAQGYKMQDSVRSTGAASRERIHEVAWRLYQDTDSRAGLIDQADRKEGTWGSIR
jgi:hypothetical protein